MTHPIPSETIDYERYVDGLRLQIQTMQRLAAAREKQFAAARKERDSLRKSNARLIEAVRAAMEMSDWFMKHSRQAEHAHEELKQPLHETAGWKEMVDAGYNGLMASYHAQFEQALANVKGGAT